jgi:phosphate transport system protein
MLAEVLPADLERLQDEVMTLGGLVEAMLLESVDLLKRCDLDALERLGEDERQIREKRLAVEMGCLQLITHQRPRDGDLRTAVAMIEIASELERVGEHAKKVARANCLTLDHHLRRPLLSIHRLATGVQAMLSRVLIAFAQRDAAAARTTFGDAEQVDALYRQVYQELLVVMNSRPRVTNQAIYLSRAAYNLKRAAERVAGICEWVVFSVTGIMEEPQSSHLSQTTPNEFVQQQPVNR